MIDQRGQYHPLLLGFHCADIAARAQSRRQFRPFRAIKPAPAPLISALRGPRNEKQVAQALPHALLIVIFNARILDLRQARVDPAFQVGAAFRRVVAGRGHLGLPEHVDELVGACQQGPEALRTARLDQRIGIIAGRQRHEAQGLARLQQRQGALCRAQCGALAGCVAVEAQHRLVGDAPDEADLIFGQRGPQGGDGIRQSGLGQRDHVCIALGDDDRAGLARCLARHGEVVQAAPLVEERRLGGVEIFRLAVPQDTPAKRDHPAAAVIDRKDHPVEEIVPRVAPAFRQFDEPGLDQLILAHAARLHRLQQTPAPVRRVAEAKPADRLVGEPAPAQIVIGRLAARLRKMFLVPATDLLDDVIQGRADFRAFALLGRGLRHLQAGQACEPLDRLGEAQPVGLHHEGDDVAMLAAAEAMIEGLVVVHRKRRRLFIVERAQAGELPALADKAHLLAHDLRHRKPRAQLIEKLRRKGQVRSSCAIGCGHSPARTRQYTARVADMTGITY